MNGSIADYYEGRSILVTGASGFMGKVLVEKLLYACPGIEYIFIFIRPKRGKSIESRQEEMFKFPLFDRIRNENPALLEKVIPVPAELDHENLGLNDEWIAKLNKVTLVFHAAASVRFDLQIKAAVKMNLEGTYRLLEICMRLKQLELFVHLSTTFCHCELKVLDERIHRPDVSPQDIIRICNSMSDNMIQTITPKLMGEHPNAYTFSKRLSEALVDDYHNKLPVTVVRPSIVIPSWKEPFPGWVDNLNGPMGLLVAGGKGVMRSMLGNPENHAEVMPVDLGINAIIAIPWYLMRNPEKPFKSYTETPVFNITQSGTNPITWGEIRNISYDAAMKYPFEMMLWYPGGEMRLNKFVHMLYVIFFQWIPAYFIDSIMVLIRQKPFMIHVQNRISNGLEVLQYFTTREWEFKNDNLVKLRESMDHLDKIKFRLDFENVDVVEYITNGLIGTRHYVLKEDPASFPKARRLLKILYVLHCISKGLFYLLLVWIIVCCSDTAKYVFDSTTELVITPFLQQVKHNKIY